MAEDYNKEEKPVIDRMFDGEVYISEMFNPYLKGHYTAELNQIMTEEEAFRESLPEEYRAGFDKVINRRIEAASLEYVELFSEGFSMGAKLIIQVYHPMPTKPV